MLQYFEGSFEVENYLQYQGISFVERFDANSYLYLTRSMDRFDLSEHFQGKLEKSVSAFDLAISLNPKNAIFYKNKCYAL